MRPVDQDCRRSRRQLAPECRACPAAEWAHSRAKRRRQNRSRCDDGSRVIAISDHAVRRHRAAEQLGCGVLLCRFQCSRSVRCAGGVPSMPQQRTVGSLSHPAAETQPAAVEKLEKLRHRVGAVLRVQQRVGQRRLAPEVRRVAQQASERMLRRQFLERSDQRPNSVIRGRYSDAAGRTPGACRRRLCRKARTP